MSKKLMLVVEDSSFARAVYVNLFKETYEILEATDGIEALEIMENHRENLDVVLLDIVMPKMDGLDVLKVISSKKGYENIPIIAITTSPEYQLEALRLGAWDFVTKDSNKDIIEVRVQNVFSRRQLIKEYERHRINEERYETVFSCISDIIIEWDAKNDRMVASNAFKEKFGYKLTYNNFFKECLNEKCIVAEDLPRIISLYENLKVTKKFNTAEFRIMDIEGNAVWCKISATAIFNNEGKPVKVIGLLNDINEYKNKIDKLRKKADIDYLTKVFSRIRFEEIVKKNLLKKNDGMGLVIIDLDKFKTVNDTLGHLSGDEVLRETSKRITIAFENKAIIGRYGGDEFAVYICPCSKKELKDHLQELWELTQKPIKINDLQYVQTVSSGAYFIKRNADSSLFQSYSHADDALYKVKKNGKNNFLIL